MNGVEQSDQNQIPALLTVDSQRQSITEQPIRSIPKPEVGPASSGVAINGRGRPSGDPLHKPLIQEGDALHPGQTLPADGCSGRQSLPSRSSRVPGDANGSGRSPSRSTAYPPEESLQGVGLASTPRNLVCTYTNAKGIGCPPHRAAHPRFRWSQHVFPLLEPDATAGDAPADANLLPGWVAATASVTHALPPIDDGEVELCRQIAAQRIFDCEGVGTWRQLHKTVEAIGGMPAGHLS